MNKRSGQKRTNRKDNSLSASSESNQEQFNKKEVTNLIQFNQPFKCRNKVQKELINLINEKDIVIAAGPAGTGKSFSTIARALELIKNPSTPYTKLIIVKPAVTIDEEHGFIKGTLREKLEPHIASTLDVLDKLIGDFNRVQLEALGYIKIEALAFLRGKSIDNSILVMEEAQNMTHKQMKTLLTRLGEDSKFIISGDLDQSDLYDDITKSGLYDAMKRHRNIEEFGFIEFTEDDIVRHPIISKILANYK